jgi:uncharacterized protein
MVAVPMFPLGTVLLPGAVLPLHVFEPRYRQMVRDCRAADGMFGVVLIERGHEVGGGDTRTDVGTLARIVDAQELPDGRWVVVAVGDSRVQVDRWLPDDPYPQAEVRVWPDELGDVTAAADHRDRVLPLLRRCAALLRELGEAAPPLDLDLDDDLVSASYQAVAVSPLGPADRQQLLTAPTVGDRWAGLYERLDEMVDLLVARLGFTDASGGDDPG